MTTAAPASKPAWTRCPGCKDRVFNDKLDIGIHRGHCPADLQRSIQDLGRKLALLEKTVNELSEDLEQAPAIDLDDIAPWTGETVEGAGDEFVPEVEDLQVSQYADDTEFAPADEDEVPLSSPVGLR